VATAYILLLGITTVMEERGLTRNSNLATDVAQVRLSRPGPARPTRFSRPYPSIWRGLARSSNLPADAAPRRRCPSRVLHLIYTRFTPAIRQASESTKTFKDASPVPRFTPDLHPIHACYPAGVGEHQDVQGRRRRRRGPVTPPRFTAIYSRFTPDLHLASMMDRGVGVDEARRLCVWAGGDCPPFGLGLTAV
jgi:hypothetical protein